MPSSTSEDAAKTVRARALAEGFDAVRFAPADLTATHAERLRAFLADGCHGGMDWMAKNAEKRAHPRALWPEAQSVIVLGVNYGPAGPDYLGPVSLYARGADYHDVIKKRLKRLAGFIFETFKAEVKVFVDTAPVLEKALAEAAGLGWQGKHTNLVSRDFGSWLFLGSIFTTLHLPADAPGVGSCGACRACQDACPTHAFPAPYRLDARRCISYLTIEHKGPIARELRPAIGGRLYGCDACLAACPWNKFAKPAAEEAFLPRPELSAMTLADFVRLDEAAFRALFRASPIKRIGRERFVRNALIAMGNGGDPANISEAERLLDDASPLVRGAAVWSLSRLTTPSHLAQLAETRMPGETDPDVLEEWHAARR